MEPVPAPDVHVDNVETANVTTEHASNDTVTVRLVVASLAMIVLSIIIGNIILILNSQSMPESLNTLGAASAGGLAAMLASTASRRT